MKRGLTKTGSSGQECLTAFDAVASFDAKAGKSNQIKAKISDFTVVLDAILFNDWDMEDGVPTMQIDNFIIRDLGENVEILDTKILDNKLGKGCRLEVNLANYVRNLKYEIRAHVSSTEKIALPETIELVLKINRYERNTQLVHLSEELKIKNKNYPYTSSEPGKEKMKNCLRKLHGFGAHGEIEKDETKKITYSNIINSIKKHSLMDDVLSGQEVIAKIDNTQIGDKIDNTISINGQRVIAYQKNVQFFYDSEATTEDEIAIIKQVMLQGENSISLSKADQSLLDQKYKHSLLRVESDQYIDRNAKALAPPQKRIFYFSSFPNLENPNTHDFTNLVQGRKIVKDDYKREVKKTFKLMLMVAHQNKEALDVVTPQFCSKELAWFEESNGKRYFVDAILEVLSEEKCGEQYSDVPAIFLHEEDYLQTKSHELLKVEIPVIINTGCPSDPQKIALNQELSFSIAETLMSHPLPLSKDFEEGNQLRSTYWHLVANPKFNSYLKYDMVEVDIESEKSGIKCWIVGNQSISPIRLYTPPDSPSKQEEYDFDYIPLW
jgi:hypothetical protein